MISIVKGVVYARTASVRTVMTAGGIAYDITVADGAPGQVGEPIELVCWTFHNENEHVDVMLGFSDLMERDVARLVYTVDGVGPVMAHRIVTALGVESMADAIVAGDAKALTHVRGLGKKTADKIIQALKDSNTIIACTGVSKASPALAEAFKALTAAIPPADHHVAFGIAAKIASTEPEATAQQIVKDTVIQMGAR